MYILNLPNLGFFPPRISPRNVWHMILLKSSQIARSLYKYVFLTSSLQIVRSMAVIHQLYGLWRNCRSPTKWSIHLARWVALLLVPAGPFSRTIFTGWSSGILVTCPSHRSCPILEVWTMDGSLNNWCILWFIRIIHDPSAISTIDCIQHIPLKDMKGALLLHEHSSRHKSYKKNVQAKEMYWT